MTNKQKQNKINMDNFGSLVKQMAKVLTPSVEAVAQTIKDAPEMAQKIYNGLADGSKMTRAAIIQALYDEQKKKETVELIRESIVENLRIDCIGNTLFITYDGKIINEIDLNKV